MLASRYISFMAKKRPLTITQVARRGGQARAKKLTPAQRSAIARQAAVARWAKHPHTQETP